MGRNNLGKQVGAGAQHLAEDTPPVQHIRAHCDIYKCYTQERKKSQINQKPSAYPWTLRSHWVATASPHQQWDWHGGPRAALLQSLELETLLVFFLNTFT